ncbi:MAG: hypothetical protein QF860_02130 [Planctomycetota bacterium]|nr:hypothetical protein [Planctomycetota bacterium]
MRSLPLLLSLALGPPAVAQFDRPSPPGGPTGQGPIHMVFDYHVDPWDNDLSPAEKWSTYHAWIDNTEWVLDLTESYGVPLGFNASGPFLEMVSLDPAGGGGRGAALLRRIYAGGRQLGSHCHTERKEGPLDWPPYGFGADLAESRRTWQDAIDALHAAILTAFAGAPPEPLSVIADLKEYHVPTDDFRAHKLFREFDMRTRAGKGQGEFLNWYGHHVWWPHRPTPGDALVGDPTAFPTAVAGGRVIGLAPDENMGQDMTIPNAKRLFLQLYVNWRWADRSGREEAVWNWGFACKPNYADPSDASRPALEEFLAWLDLHFADAVEPTGSAVMTWSTHRDVVEAFEAWELRHPADAAFSHPATGVDWSQYPFLRPVAEELVAFSWAADLDLGGGVTAFGLERAGTDAVLCWRAEGASTVDVSGLLGPSVRAVDLESGSESDPDPGAVPVGTAALLVIED